MTQEVAEPQDNRALDWRLAYALLRLTLGINIFVHGAVRLPALGTFVKGMIRQFANTPLPGTAVRLFALSLPFLEAGVGLLLIVGLWTRWALVAGALEIAALVFGTALRSDWETLGIQMLYAIIYYLLLTGRMHDYFSLDTLRTKQSRPDRARYCAV